MKTRVLYCGDTEIEVVTVHKAFDSYGFSLHRDDSVHLQKAFDEDPEIVYKHLDIGAVFPEFPLTVAEMREYDAVILSDVGFKNLQFTPGFRPPFEVPMSSNRVNALRQYVEEGGGLMMVGGFMSFAGIDGKAGYAGTAIEEVLPVTCSHYDDRSEVVEGFKFTVEKREHPVMQGLPWEQEFLLLGYNRVSLRQDSELLASYNGDPIIAARERDKGRSLIFASDVAPHWSGNFLDWPGYADFWRRCVKWLGRAL